MGVEDADVNFGAAMRHGSFKPPRRACIAQGPVVFGADSVVISDVCGVLASRALCLLSAGVRLGAAARRDRFEESFPAVLARGLRAD